MNKFFVYGTLKVGGFFAEAFDELRTECKNAKLKGFDLFKIGGGSSSWFPGIIKGKGEVIGELHAYNKDYIKEVFANMDAIEGYNEKDPARSLYRREKAVVELEDGSTEEANVYIFNNKMPKEFPKIESGIWPIKN